MVWQATGEAAGAMKEHVTSAWSLRCVNGARDMPPPAILRAALERVIVSTANGGTILDRDLLDRADLRRPRDRQAERTRRLGVGSASGLARSHHRGGAIACTRCRRGGPAVADVPRVPTLQRADASRCNRLSALPSRVRGMDAKRGLLVEEGRRRSLGLPRRRNSSVAKA